VCRKGKARFPVQTVIRPKTEEEYHDFRGYAGKLYGNNIKVGCHNGATFFEGIESINIHFFDKQFEEASVGSSLLSN
jgi:sulfate adenylyltransferase subunit 1